ncbi:SDR family NAD(P)-dependent oxidoreductase [Macrococcus armenti]|uniref:SDR family NAD(P)-dependent oxidoreductase n=1 Tax=Macrococcus armenti TaxID=2875764 RepID=UPI001CC91B9A|nr:SDR family NAD(P)-dependent oxidoreductase [Macrococcus armenti]UBH14438.1 SDR family NAD(P)-dependent oxidoreductase [Macrococcus armenti]UBH16798.1 SDR family NAD(P)-dependent oxidoreductase [Macrococcus armenti]UBH19061.1 SDR family NAD(P)-dependent oxidoreductase [Macrococcus armenti]
MDKTILITGATGGVGYNTAVKLLEEGHHLFLCGRNISSLAVLAKAYPECTVIKCDFSGVDSTLKFVEKIKGIDFDVVIFSAGYAHYANIKQLSIEEMDAMNYVNYQSVYVITKSLLKQHKLPHIIVLGSLSAYSATPGGAIYSASKAALNQLMNALRLENPNLNVTMINTGPIDTAFIYKATGKISRLNKLIMIKTDSIVSHIVKVIKHPKKEINRPMWMYVGLKIYNIAPRTIERILKPLFMTKL